MGWSHFSSHAVSRYRERVDPTATYDQIVAVLDSPRIREMIAFGACSIVLPTGHRAPVVDGVIVTVKPKPGKKTRRYPGEQE